MNKLRDENFESFLNDTDKTLEELDEYQRVLYSEIDDLNNTASQQMLRNFRSGSDVPGGLPVDGYCNINVSEDKLTVYGDFYPPTYGMKPLFKSDVARQLAEEGIAFGIAWEKIDKAIFDCNAELSPQTEIVVASGNAPEPLIPAHYVITDELLHANSTLTSDDKSSRIDFRDVSPFKMVKKGDVIARLLPETTGIYGEDVYGNEIPYVERKPLSLAPGKNTQESDGTIIATCEGRFESGDDKFWVNEILLISTDVGYQTGNIDFPGDVIIHGQVNDNFSIKSGASVFCEGTLDASFVECAGDLVVKMGVIGRKKGVVKSGGQVRAKFLENCYVEAQGDVSILTGIIHSSIYTNGHIDCRPRGIIIGGTLYAQTGISAFQIGSQMAPKTEIYCGIDYLAMNKMKWIKEKNMHLAFSLRKVNTQIARATGNSLPKLQAMQKKLKAAISQLNESAALLVFNLDKNDSAKVDVYGTIYPGVYIEISHISFIVTRQMTRVRFRLNKEEGRIVTEPIYESK